MDIKKVTFLMLRRRRRKQARDASLSNRLKQGLLTAGIGLSILLAVFIITLAVSLAGLMDDLPSLEQIPVLLNAEDGELLQPTRIYDRSGTKVYLSLENPGIPRRYLPLDPEQPEYFPSRLLQMTIALEDTGFWQHPGIDWQHLTSPEAGTLAEQLVDRLLLYDEPQSFKRTLHMRLLAAQLISHYGRSQVLEWYLNSAYYGHLAYGADSAAWLYFDKPASRLDVAEAALLVAMSQTPALNPLDSPAAARERHHEVLEQLLAADAISQVEYDQAILQELVFRETQEDENNRAAAFTRLVLEQLEQEIDIHRIEMGGLRIITTLDDDLQTQLTCAVQAQLTQLLNEEMASDCKASRLLPTLPPSAIDANPQVMASALVLDPKNGQVLAMTGKSTLEQEKDSISGHQPGSMLTPFIAVAGFSRGFSPSSLVWDIPASTPEELTGMQNPDGEYHGPMRLRMALANDYLSPLAKLLVQFTPENVWKLTEPFGLTELDTTDPAEKILYEGGDVTSLELAWAYIPFATGGSQSGEINSQQDLQPVTVLSIEDVAGRIWKAEPLLETHSVLSPQLAYLVHDVLADPVARRESLGYPNALETGNQSAAKTGQADNGRQVWTIGYTPERLVETWIGLPDEVECEDCQLDVRAAAGLWHALMQYSSRELPASGWSMPAGISTRQVCDPSGLLPTLDCPSIVSEIFLDGSEPAAYDNLYRVYQINRETELLATVFTPLELVEERTYLVVPDEALSWAQQNNIAMPPTTYDIIQAPQASTDAYITEPSLFAYVRGQLKIYGTAAGDGFGNYRLQIGKGLNPESWQQIGTDQNKAVQDGILATWDTSGQEDGLYALRLVVQRQKQEVSTAITQVTIDNTPPEVRLLYPQNDQELPLPSNGEINLQADAIDNIGQARLEWFVDGKKVGEQNNAPYTLAWQASRGTHTISLTAYDLAGNSRDSDEVEVKVISNGN